MKYGLMAGWRLSPAPAAASAAPTRCCWPNAAPSSSSTTLAALSMVPAVMQPRRSRWYAKSKPLAAMHWPTSTTLPHRQARKT